MARTDKEAVVLKDKGRIRSKKVMNVALRLAAERGEDTVIYDVSSRNPLVRYAIITSGASDRRLESLTQEAEAALKDNGFVVDHVEGKNGSQWFLVDASSVVVHAFSREERERVKLDALYAPLPHKTITDDEVEAYVKGSSKEEGD